MEKIHSAATTGNRDSKIETDATPTIEINHMIQTHSI